MNNPIGDQPTFPTTEIIHDGPREIQCNVRGMTLRQHYAGISNITIKDALEALKDLEPEKQSFSLKDIMKTRAIMRRMDADALLEELGK